MSAELALRLERVLPAPPPRAFAVHVQPDAFSQWFGPKGFSATMTDLDLRVGGGYRIRMRPPHGDAFFIFGEFREIDPDRRLAYTFLYEPPDPDDLETVVVLTFGNAGGATALTLEHGPFANEARRALHEQGWTDSLDRLQELIQTHQ